MAKMKNDLVGLDLGGMLRPAVETAEERQARCRRMRITLGGAVLTFEELRRMFDKTRVAGDMLETRRRKMVDRRAEEIAVGGLRAEAEQPKSAVEKLMGKLTKAGPGTATSCSPRHLLLGTSPSIFWTLVA